ncbi:MAG: preprotein translocase subunit SecG [Porphyromonas sp.]|nr:preprotein translocase subunit SecG [Porphyromonas sp.]
MYIFLSILILIVTILLVFIVTIQNPKGGGLASGFASSNSIMGVRKTTDLLEKVTWGLAGIMVVLSLLIARWAPRNTVSSQPTSVIEDYVDNATIPAPAEALPFGDTTAPSDATPAETPQNN